MHRGEGRMRLKSTLDTSTLIITIISIVSIRIIRHIFSAIMRLIIDVRTAFERFQIFPSGNPFRLHKFNS